MEWIRLSVDSGLFILVWLVQIIIYPSFLYIDREKLNYWHRLYTGKILYFVAPLMFIQTGVIALQILSDPLIFLLDGFFLAMIWINTFLLAIPIHNSIDQGENVDKSISKLLQVNRWRSWMWTALFLLSAGRILLDFLI
ncbi:hypothetical protein KUV23_11850 [Algoriphagus marincola]|uniref:DUF4149 domain-containing protein n=1 Tax=Algoriphagus marincola TaxID=264027 RepID=A0ABS7N5U2_9BACT|nr:hypothetical protein [Algoriphagus marincola]MBY5951673.1 hypothetical protein [Algoriphagus marincola]